MNLTAIEAAIKAWVQAITQVDAAFVLFQDEPRPMYNGVLVLLNITTIVGQGIDEITQTYDSTPGAESITYTAAGNRKISLSIQCQTHDQRASNTARQALENARTRAWFPSAQGILRDANMSLVALGTVVNSPYKVDQHWASRYVLDVQLGVISELIDTPTETIEAVSGNGTVAGVDVPFEVPA